MTKVSVLVAGYVVQMDGKGNRFLSRGKRFVKHSTRGSKVGPNQLGIERAYVHSEEDLAKGGDWTEKAGKIYVACYSRDTNLTGVSCQEMSYDDFMKKYDDFVDRMLTQNSSPESEFESFQVS
ncbi:MAG: hypothetical protein WC694_02485 [Candidatus Paceibacterota bacterium]|jgi:hypothetical protein